MIIVKNKTNIRLVASLVMILLLASCSKDGYRIEGDKVVYESPWNAGNFTVIHELDADPATLEILGGDNLTWAKDTSKVYRRYKYLEYMHAPSFKVLSINFAKDKDKVICGREIIKETNPVEFKVKMHKEKNGHTYIYGIDKNAAYLCSLEPSGYRRIPSNDIDTFEQLEESFYKDKEKVWWGSSELADAKPSTFKVLEGGYATDGNNVYYRPSIVKGADPATFKVTGNFRAKDKNYYYEFADRIKSVSGNEQLFSIEVSNKQNDLVKVPIRLNSGEVTQAWERMSLKIKEAKISYKDHIIYHKSFGNEFNNGGLSSGASTADYGIVVDEFVKLEEIESFTFAWIELESGLEREVSVDVKGLIPESYNGGILHFKIMSHDQVVAEFE